MITELEGKRNDPEIGYFARQALRNLDELRIQHERLDFPDRRRATGGSLRVELNHSNMSVLPSGLQLGDNDSRILAVALNLANDGLDVTVVSKDLPLRVKAASIGLAAEEYRAELAVDSGWTGHGRDRRSARSRWPSSTTTRQLSSAARAATCRSTPASSSTRTAARRSAG